MNAPLFSIVEVSSMFTFQSRTDFAKEIVIGTIQISQLQQATSKMVTTNKNENVYKLCLSNFDNFKLLNNL